MPAHSRMLDLGRRTLFLWQVLLLYLVVAWVVVEVIASLPVPSWVHYLVVLLLILGLPIAVIAAFVQEGRDRRSAEETADARSYADVAQHVFRWDTAAAALLVTVVLLAFAAAGWFIFETGIAVSVVGSIVFLAVLLDCWRRLGRYPVIRYSATALSQREIRRFWAFVLTFTFGLALEGFASPTLRNGNSWEGAESPRYLESGAISGGRFYQLPFYRYHVEEQQAADGKYTGSETEEATIPWTFFLAAALYWFYVVKWPVANGRATGLQAVGRRDLLETDSA